MIFIFSGNQLHNIFTGPVITAAIALPIPFATSLLQQHVNSTFEGLPGFTPVPVHPVVVQVRQLILLFNFKYCNKN